MTTLIPTWYDDAACSQTDPEVFFPDSRGDTLRHHESAARSVCAHCPVQRTCLQWALEQRIEFGVWGGMTERERAVVLKRSAA